jgi:hypothetical protein
MNLGQLFVCVVGVVLFCLALGYLDASARKALHDCRKASLTVNCEYLLR